MIDIDALVAAKRRAIEAAAATAASAAGKEMYRATREVLQGERRGRVYRLPGGSVYQASAPGESPAKRTRDFRDGWDVSAPNVQTAPGRFSAEVGLMNRVFVGRWVLGEILERGTAKMAPRPYKDKIRAAGTAAFWKHFGKKGEL